MLLSYYTQDNDHSAVTGGIGTEDLQVYASQYTIDKLTDSVRSFHVDMGVDIISSASTDNIDFEMSSASKVDARIHANTGISRVFKGSGIKAGINTGLSVESDYLSWGLGFTLSMMNEDQSRELSLVIGTFFDDLRWGRLRPSEPRKLIYPEELRSTNWFDIYRRNSYNFSFGLYQIINKRMTLGLYPGVSYQQGLLSTPFHRVYFTDDSERVENLPQSRLKISVGAQLNTFIGSRWIMRLYYRFCWDDFGLKAHTISVESPVKITPFFSLIPFFRFYTQQGVSYFKPYYEHDVSETYYTSDYDLSKFKSYKPGMSLRYAPFAKKKRRTFKAIELRYAFYKRSDGLTANMISAFINLEYDRRQKDQQNKLP